ncbi:MAG TPA: YciI family protein [Actinomycetota bacterium]|nr:YciI family protein [Actinomycetota bacterium]
MAGYAPPPATEASTMAQYLLSVHSVEGEAAPSMTDEDMQQYVARIHVLEDEMKSAGAWVFGGALHGPDTATVVRVSNDEVLTTDGPFAESREHLGGFYIIETEDLDAALAWASKVTAIVTKPIEVRPFRAVSGA